MAATMNSYRQMIQALKEKPKPANTGRVISVDVIGLQAIVRIAGSPAGVSLRVADTALAQRLKSQIDAGNTPTVTINQFYIIEDFASVGAAAPVTTTTVVVGDINVTALNTDFYNHIANPDAHHTAFIGLTDNANTVVNPNVSDRIRIYGSGGITVTAGTSELLITASGLVPTTRQIIAGNGLTGTQDLSSDPTLNVGAGNGISVAADSVAVNQGYNFTWTAQHTYNIPLAMPPFVLNSNAQGQTVVGLRADQLNKNVIAGTGLTGGGLLTADRTLNVDQSYNFVWTNSHTWTDPSEFQSNLTTTNLIPGTSQSDIGTQLKMYQTAYIGEIMATVFAENTIQIIGGDFYITKNSGSLPFFVDAADTTVDFGKAMIPNDFVRFKNQTQSETMQVLSLVSGTTYNVNRGTAHDWPEQSAFAVWGYTGDGFIRLSASDTPQINMYLQDNDFDAQFEITRIGNLNGWQGYATNKYGLALGRYQIGYPNLVFDGDDGSIRIRRYNTDVLRFDATANYLANPLILDSNGGIFQGDGTFDIPERGLKISNSGGYGIIQGYNNFAVQASFNSLGEITWLGGEGVLNAGGATIGVESSFNISRGFRFKNSVGTVFGGLFGISGIGPDTRTVRVYSEALTGQFAYSELRAYNTASALTALVRTIASNSSSDILLSATNIVVSPDTLTTVQGPSASIIPTTLNLGTATTTAITLGRSAAPLTINSPTVTLPPIITIPTSIPTFTGDGAYLLSNTNNRGLDGWYNRIGGTSYQLSIPHVTAFPASPPTGRTVFRTDYRCLWNYDGSTWRQASVPTFNGAFPSSPQDRMRVFRSDRNYEYFWNNASGEWLTTQTFDATGIGDVRTFAAYPNTLTVATAVLTFHVDNRLYAVRVVDSYIDSMVTATNNGSNYWNYTIGYLNNNGGGAVTLLTGNTSGQAANTSVAVTMSDVTIPANATSGRVAVTLNVTNSPSSYTIRGTVKYRLVG